MFNINHKKGWFPHFFNTHENMDYVGKYPDIEYYSPDSMNESDRSDFMIWYQDKINTKAEFNFKFELINY